MQTRLWDRTSSFRCITVYFFFLYFLCQKLKKSIDLNFLSFATFSCRVGKQTIYCIFCLKMFNQWNRGFLASSFGVCRKCGEIFKYSCILRLFYVSTWCKFPFIVNMKSKLPCHSLVPYTHSFSFSFFISVSFR